MRRDSTIYLVPSTASTNAIGDTIWINGEPRMLLAEKKSIRQSEFYQAEAIGLKPELVFVIWPHEYHDESILKYNQKDYKIIRIFENNFKDLELICEGVVNNGDA